MAACPLGANRLAKKAQQFWQVVRPLAQRAGMQRQHVEPVIQILAKTPGSDLGFQVAVGCGDHPNIDGHRLAAAHWVDLALLQHAQQLYLHVQRQIANFVEEYGSAMGQLESANPVGHGTRESPLAVPEQLAFNQVFGNGCTVDRYKIAASALGLLMQGAGHQFLAGAALARDQHRGLRIGHPGNHGPHSLCSLTFSNKRVGC